MGRDSSPLVWECNAVGFLGNWNRPHIIVWVILGSERRNSVYWGLVCLDYCGKLLVRSIAPVEDTFLHTADEDP